MNEKDIRARIEQFLKRTAQTVVVPASVGLGLVGCDSHSLQVPPADAAARNDLASEGKGAVADSAVAVPDRPADLAAEMPQIMPPYLMVWNEPDSAVASSPEVRADGTTALDGGADADDAQPRADVGVPELPDPPLPYVFLLPASDTALADGPGLPAPPYLLMMADVTSAAAGPNPTPTGAASDDGERK